MTLQDGIYVPHINDAKKTINELTCNILIPCPPHTLEEVNCSDAQLRRNLGYN